MDQRSSVSHREQWRSRDWFGREHWIRGVGSPTGSNGEEGPLFASIVLIGVLQFLSFMVTMRVSMDVPSCSMHGSSPGEAPHNWSLTILSEDWGGPSDEDCFTFFLFSELFYHISVWMRVHWELFSKIFFIWKYIKIIFFYFLKIIFNINILKWFRNIKKILI